MLSPLSGPSDPDFRGGFHPTSIQREPFSLITLALLLLRISPWLLVFILPRRSGPGPGRARPADTDVNSYQSYMNGRVQLMTSQDSDIVLDDVF